MNKKLKSILFSNTTYSSLDSNLKYFLFAIFVLGINQGILNSTFNNYLYETFNLTAKARGALEIPRELPGFLSILVTGILTFLTVRSWAIIVGLLAAIGIAGMGYLSPTVSAMVIWMFLWSLADHLFMSVESIMGLKLAKKNEEGKILGKIGGVRNLSAIVGSIIIFYCMGHLKWNFKDVYTIAVITALLAAITFYFIRLDSEEIPPKKFVYNKKYNLFYLLNLLFGARKQIFLTFAPWVLITIYHTSADTMALLFTISAGVGFVFRQWFGVWVDKYGERSMLIIDSFILFLICFAFAFIQNVYILYGFFIIDALMFATRIARTTYLHKIVIEKRDLAPTISLGISIDHIASMLIPSLGGYIWYKFGYKPVFITASLIAFLNYIAARKIKV